MKTLAVLTAALWLAGCTSVTEVVQDAGELRAVAKDSIGRQVDGVRWRDVMVMEIHQDRIRIMRRAAEDLASRGELEQAEAVWAKALELLAAYDPVGAKVENIRRVYTKIRGMEADEAGP